MTDEIDTIKTGDVAPDDIAVGLQALVRCSMTVAADGLTAAITRHTTRARYAAFHGEIVKIIAVSRPYMMFEVLSGPYHGGKYDAEISALTLMHPDPGYLKAKLEAGNGCTCQRCAERRTSRKWWQFWKS